MGGGGGGGNKDSCICTIKYKTKTHDNKTNEWLNPSLKCGHILTVCLISFLSIVYE